MTGEYTLFSSSHESFIKIDHLLRHKRILNKYKAIETMKSTIYDQINLKNNRKIPKYLEIKQYNLKIFGGSSKKFQGKLANHFIGTKIKIQISKLAGCFPGGHSIPRGEM